MEFLLPMFLHGSSLGFKTEVFARTRSAHAYTFVAWNYASITFNVPNFMLLLCAIHKPLHRPHMTHIGCRVSGYNCALKESKQSLGSSIVCLHPSSSHFLLPSWSVSTIPNSSIRVESSGWLRTDNSYNHWDRARTV